MDEHSLSSHLTAIHERSHDEAERLASLLRPDRTVPAALAWVRAWGPSCWRGALPDIDVSPN
jgi:hypothetical protein